ncbi:MAG: hypothetical protein AB1421_12735 [Pseudomonadota bacterium]
MEPLTVPPLDLTIQSLQSFLNQLAQALPSVLGALTLVLVGWIIAKLLKAGVGRVLYLLRFHTLAQKSGIEAFLREGGVSMSLTGLLSGLAYWFVMLITIVMAANSLGLTVVATLFNQAALYLPNVVAAVLVLVLGILAARFVNRLLFAFLRNARFEGALGVSTFAEYAITVFVIFMALEQLRISTALLHTAFQLGFGALCLAFALAFGLGGREWAADMLRRLSKREED